MVNMDEWRASLTEYRIAGITALIGIALVLLISTWPELFTIKQDQTRPVKAQVADAPGRAEQVPTPLPAAPAAVEQAVKEKSAEQLQPKVIDAEKTAPTESKQAAAPVEKPAPKAASPAGGYYVQTGAFKDAAGAEAVAGKLRAHGWPAIVVPKGGLFAVWAGPRQGRDAIEKLQQEIQRGLNIKGFIVQKKGS